MGIADRCPRCKSRNIMIAKSYQRFTCLFCGHVWYARKKRRRRK